MGDVFELVTDFTPRGDQPQAIEEICKGLDGGQRYQVLLGVTGSGKTFTAAQVIAHYGRPTLVLAPNKTLAAQLYAEFRELFPNNAVQYFVSYYDYYQPEAYVPSSDTYIEKDAIINDEIDRMRHAATHALLSREDVIIVASVSCIYGIGSSESYQGMIIHLEAGLEIARDQLLRRLVDIQYERNDVDFHRGTFRVRGDVVEIFPAYEQSRAIRVEMWGDEIDTIKEIDPLRGRVLGELRQYHIYPGSHYVTERQKLERAMEAIRSELGTRLEYFDREGRFLEKQRVEERTMYDLEMLEQMGFCNGIENYARHLSGRPEGEPPPTLVDYFPDDFLMIIDESHQTVPQLGAMYRGDRARKTTLVEHGFRLPSALDNRPLKFQELEGYMNHVLFVSATPGEHEFTCSEGVVVEQIIRPTGLIDPEIEVRPVGGQVDDLLGLIRERTERGERVLCTTLTKRMSEDLTEYYAELGIKVRYLHSDHRHARARGDLARPSPRRVRRARGHQPVARGARSSRGVAGGHSRRGQGGFSAQPAVSHSDDRPRSAKRERQGGDVRRPDHRLYATRHRRDQPAPRDPESLQRGAWHHPQDHRQGHPRHLSGLGQPRLLRGEQVGSQDRSRVGSRRRARRARLGRDPAAADVCRRRGARVRASGAPPRPAQAAARETRRHHRLPPRGRSQKEEEARSKSPTPSLRNAKRPFGH